MNKQRPLVMAASIASAKKIAKLLQSKTLTTKISPKKLIATGLIPPQIYELIAGTSGVIRSVVIELGAREFGIGFDLSSDLQRLSICIVAETETTQIRLLAWLPDLYVARWLLECARAGSMPLLLATVSNELQEGLLLNVPFGLNAEDLKRWISEVEGLLPDEYSAAFIRAARELGEPRALGTIGEHPPRAVVAFALTTDRKTEMVAVAGQWLKSHRPQ